MTANSLRSLGAEEMKPLSSGSACDLPVSISELTKPCGRQCRLTDVAERVTKEKERIIDEIQIDKGEGSGRVSDMLCSDSLSLSSSEIESWKYGNDLENRQNSKLQGGPAEPPVPRLSASARAFLYMLFFFAFFAMQ